MPRLKHVPGSRFGHLVIVSRLGLRITCRCDCGNETVVHIANLCTGHTTSCGCHRAETTAVRSFRHGAARRGRHSAAYHSWASMLKRCHNPKSADYRNYGERGITVCPRWRDSFSGFLEDMGNPPDGCSIDRIDNDGPYSRENCRWATRADQNRNTRRNHRITSNGRTQTLAEWARELGVHHTTILRRLRQGQTPEQAVSRVADVV